jgi:NADH-quinone oxidoreductase subunit C
MAKILFDLVTRHLREKVTETHADLGDETVVVRSDCWYEVHALLRDEPFADMQMLVDLTVVDFPSREPRFEVVTHLLSLRLGHRLRVKTRVGTRTGEDAVIDTLTPLWASASWAERESFDMMGVVFRGHPDLRRILLYPEFVGYPLRKDYDVALSQPLVPYREVNNAEKVAPFGVDEGRPLNRKALRSPRASGRDEREEGV